MKEQVALVTGGARRIGAAIVRHLHASGHSVWIHHLHAKEEAMQLVNEFNGIRENSANASSIDLNNISSCEALIKQVLTWKGRLNILVNNASLFVRTPLPGLYDDTWDALWQLNVKVPYWLSHAAFHALSENTGVIINITDIHGQNPLKDYSLYCQTKAALAMQTKALAQEYAPKIRVNAIAPGAIAWPEGDNVLTISQQEAIIKKTLLKKHGDPRWIAHAVLSLIENEFITGQILNVDGGRA